MNLTTIIAIVLFVIALKMNMEHRKLSYDGEYKKNGGYLNVSAVKHDVLKIGFITFFPLLVYGVPENTKFFDTSNIINSWVGRTSVTLAGFFIFHELIQPYTDKLPNF